MNDEPQARVLTRMLEPSAQNDSIIVIYDGLCIFCNSYIKLMRLRASVGPVLLLDARTDRIAQQVKQILNLDLDDGMLVIYGDQAFYGADALYVLSALTSRSNTWNATMALIFGRRWLSRLLYPVLKLGRSLALSILGRPRLKGALADY